MPITRDIGTALNTALIASGIRHDRVENYPVASIKTHLQVRHDTDAAGDVKYNLPKVREYVAKYKAGSTPPAIGVTDDGTLVWGNHRVEAARRAEVADVPAIVLHLNAADADEHTVAVLMTLSGRENAEHGLPLSAKDRELIVRKEIELGTTSGAIQQAYGMTSQQVTGLRREIDAEKRLTDLGIATAVDNAHLSRSTIRAFSGKDARALTNAPFKDLVALTIDAGLVAKDVNDIAATAKDTGTEDDAIRTIAAKRAELGQRIAELATGGTVRPTPLSRLRKVAAEATGLCDKAAPAAYRDNTADAAATKEAISAAIGCLTAILEAQDQEQ